MTAPEEGPTALELLVARPKVDRADVKALLAGYRKGAVDELLRALRNGRFEPCPLGDRIHALGLCIRVGRRDAGSLTFTNVSPLCPAP